MTKQLISFDFDFVVLVNNFVAGIVFACRGGSLLGMHVVVRPGSPHVKGNTKPVRAC